MNKIIRYLRSMRFGLLLLGLIAVCSVIGTVIPQEREIAWYAQNYSSFHGVILLLRLNRIFTSWYFVLLLALLSLNLTLCSIQRIIAVARAAKDETARAAQMPDTVFLTAEGIDRLRDRLLSRGCKAEQIGDGEVFTRNRLGRYGSFVTHLSILLTVVFGALALYTPTVTDQSCMPGESILLPDGTQIQVYDFHINDESGRLDYTSRIELRLPNGRSSGIKELKVNYPLSFGSYKLFQQSFGTAGSVTVTNLETGGSDLFYLDGMSYLTIDERNGIVFEQLYPDFVRTPDGDVTLIALTEGAYPNPIYAFEILSDGVYTPSLAVPGDALEIHGLRFAFNAPVEYPGLRIKHVSATVNALLIASFVLMIAGLYITFFLDPVVVKLDKEGYAVCGPKPERMRVELGSDFEAYEREEEKK